MKMLQLLLIGIFGSVIFVSAMNIETGKEFSADRDQSTGKLLGVSDSRTFIKNAKDKLQFMLDTIKKEQDKMNRSRFTSQAQIDNANKALESQIKSFFKELALLAQ
jgi:hypothetical protein